MTGVLTVRPDLADAHRAAWDHLAGPGAWWTAEQRAELARTAADALAGPTPLPPWSEGPFPHAAHAPDQAHTIVNRVAAHAATITEDWYRAQLASGLDPAAYVELVGLVATVAAVTSFRRGVGAPAQPVPQARPGPLTERAAALVQAHTNWVLVAPPADAVPAVVQALSATPAEHANLWRLAAAQYMTYEQMADPAWSRGTLSRAQTELVASRLARLRDCLY